MSPLPKSANLAQLANSAKSAVPDEVLWLEHIRAEFESLDMDRIMACFTDDVVVQYNALPPIRGAIALRLLLSERYQHLEDYRLKKELRLIHGPLLTVAVEASFRKQGRSYCSRIIEILTVQDRQIARWDYVGIQSEV